MALSTSTNGGGISGQINTQNPQTAGQPATNAAKSGSVQPGTASALLTTQQGVSLRSTVLPTVTLGADPAQTRTVSNPAPPQPQPKYDVNPVLLGVPVFLVVLAVVLFWTVTKSVKSTTE